MFTKDAFGFCFCGIHRFNGNVHKAVFSIYKGIDYKTLDKRCMLSICIFGETWTIPLRR